MITAVIAEKPSVAKDIANVLNVRERHDGYLSGNGYLVTWAFGHLVQLAMPEAYGYTGFRRENLPILPQEFKYIPRQIREGKEYKPDPGVLKQLKVIREVFDRSDRIVVATDAGREGEAIHRYIYNYLGCRKPCLRLWIVTRNFAASLFRNIKYFTLRKLYLCRKWMQKRLQKTTTTGITLPNFDFLA